MKCAIVFLALVVVSQAAFTGRLSQQARPILKDAAMKMRLASRSGSFRESQLADSLIASITTQAETLMGQLEAALEAGSTQVNQMVAQMQDYMGQLQALGADMTGQATSIVQDFMSNFGGWWGSIFGRNGKGAVSDHLVALIQQWNLDHHISSAINSVVDHPAFSVVAGLLEHFQMTNFVQNAIVSLLGNDMGNWLANHWNQPQGKGFFDGLTALGTSISTATQTMLSNLGNVIDHITTVAQSNFAQLHTLATQFAEEVISEAQTNLNHAAGAFLTQLGTFQQSLGPLYTQVVNEVQNVITGVLGN